MGETVFLYHELVGQMFLLITNIMGSSALSKNGRGDNQDSSSCLLRRYRFRSKSIGEVR